LASSESPGPSTPGDGANAPTPAVSIRCWGTRGSIPSPGPDTSRYGGNTSCVEIRAGATRVILDAGTGIRILGDALMEEGEVRDASVFLTHFHWDHIQGLPFFAPAYEPSFRLRLFGPRQEGETVEALLAGQMGPFHFPIPQQELPASLAFSEVDEGELTHGDFRIRAMRVRHSTITFGYRIEGAGRSVVYIPDNELEGGPFPTPIGWRDGIENFVRGADVLFHDAMFTNDEASSFQGWGHSTFEQALDLSLRAEVRKLYFFHHAPNRTDAELDALLERFRKEAADRGGDLSVHAAAEGSEFQI